MVSIVAGCFQRLGATERVGFEPTLDFSKLDFKSSAFDHSATSPFLFRNLYIVSKLGWGGRNIQGRLIDDLTFGGDPDTLALGNAITIEGH